MLFLLGTFLHNDLPVCCSEPQNRTKQSSGSWDLLQLLLLLCNRDSARRACLSSGVLWSVGVMVRASPPVWGQMGMKEEAANDCVSSDGVFI